MIGLGIMIGVGLLIVIGYSYQWTGFGASTIVTLNPNEEIQLPKTLWDWLELLVIPIVLAISAAWFSRVERRSEQAIAKQRIEEERRIADDRAQDTALQAYLEQMAMLLLDKSLRKSEEGSEERDMARAFTLTFLRRLNGERKGVLLRFLYESDLMTKEKSIFSLQLADLSGAYLFVAYLIGADLRGADLIGAYLIGADLRGADLSGAYLSGAYLGEANLSGADLSGADLSEANLSGADLSEANLSDAKYSRKTIWPDGFDPVEAGTVLIEYDEE